MATSMPCKECASGNLHSGKTTGRTATVYGLPSYIAEPPQGTAIKGIIVIVCDAFGWELPNSRILADKFARRTHCRVYMPDFLDGHHLPFDLLTSMDDWLEKDSPSMLGKLGKISPVARTVYNFAPFLFFTRLSVVKPRTYKWFSNLRTEEGASLPVGAAGYCAGGKLPTLMCHGSVKAENGQPLVDVAFVAHPSQMEAPADFEPLQLPLSISCGTKDFALPIDKLDEIQRIFDRKEKGRFELVKVEGARHGFAVRGNPGNAEAVKQGEEAEDQAVAWFGKWFG